MEDKLTVLMDFNERQQQLLKDLKHVYNWQHSHAWDLFYYLVDRHTLLNGA